MTPCERDKCLKLPACKSKRTIFCNPLYQFMFTDIQKQDEGYALLTNLIDVYRDEQYPGDGPFQGAPIINANRLADKIEKDNI